MTRLSKVFILGYNFLRNYYCLYFWPKIWYYIYCILEKGAKSCLFKQICILEGVLEMEQNKVDTNESNTTDKKTKLISKIKDLKDLPKGEGTTKKLPRIYTYFLYFLIFSVVGWLLETAFSFYSLGHFTKRGFLFGPLCPIYGWGALILIMFFSKYKKHNFKLFIYAAIVFSFFEYVVSFGMEALFSLKWWDYTGEAFNLNGRIGLFYSFAWGIIAILVINFVYPFFKKKLNLLLSKMPYRLTLFIVHGLFVVLIVDTILSCIRYFNMSV